MCNEAALLTARNNEKLITRKIFEEATIKVVAGPAKKSAVVIERERVLTAYHEAGHAIVSRLLPDTDPVHMISIVPRGRAGGFTAYTPNEDRSYRTKNEMKHDLIMLLGGRCAEHLVLDDISTGASNDIERATKIARAMVTQYGMSDKLGPILYDSDDDVFMGRDFGKAKLYSENIASEIDIEIKKLIDEAFATCLNLLKNNIDLLHRLAKILLEEETIDADYFEEIYLKYANEVGNESPPELLKSVKEKEEYFKKILNEDEMVREDNEVI